jgi:hypothetical protein
MYYLSVLYNSKKNPTNSIKQVPRASGSSSSYPGINHLLRNTNFHCRIHDNTLLVIIFIKFNPVYILTSLSLKDSV